MTADIGLIGLAVMGQNLVLNMNDHGYTVAVFNRSTDKTEAFLQGPAAGTKVVGVATIEGLVDTLASPRRIMLMVKAGQAVDDMIDVLGKAFLSHTVACARCNDHKSMPSPAKITIPCTG